MRTYGIFPVFDLTDREDALVQACISLVTEIVIECLRSGGDNSHSAMDWRNPGSGPWQDWSSDIAEPYLVPLNDAAALRQVVYMSVDPFSPGCATVIRSAANCRAATFGYDGQAFLCLRHDDKPPFSPNPELVLIEERPDLLETDYFDGWMPEDRSGKRFLSK